jgi:hypothetical protein
MTRREEIKTWLAARKLVAAEGDRWIDVLLRSATASQRLRLEWSTANHDLLIVRAHVCPREVMSLELALGVNATLLAGALTIVDRAYVLRAILWLETLTMEALDRTLGTMATAAVAIRNEVTRLPRHRELGYCSGYLD